MTVYMKFGEIQGAVTTRGFEKWIECASFQMGVGRSIGTAARGSSNREHSEPHISETMVTKMLDMASNKLFEDSIAGHLDSKVEFKFTTTTKSGVETYMHIKLRKAGLSGYSMSSGSDAPTESLSINFAHVEYSHSKLDSKDAGTPVKVTYDLEQMKANAQLTDHADL